jgi:hypothetical protein
MGPVRGPHLRDDHLHRTKIGPVISLPVGYRRSGDDVVITVSMPDAKTWWRNFLGDGAPLTITLDGRDRTGHAVARRDDNGCVAVDLRLDQP